MSHADSSTVEQAYTRTLKSLVNSAVEVSTLADSKGLRGEVVIPLYDILANEDFTDEEYEAYERVGDDIAEELYTRALSNLAKSHPTKVTFRSPRSLTWY